MDKKKVLVISEYAGGNANVIRDFLYSFNQYSRHDYYYCHNGRLIDDDFDFEAFDVILLFWSIWLLEPNPSLNADLKARIRKAPALKVLFLQDEYRQVEKFQSVMDEMGVNLMFTCVAEKDHDLFYPPSKIPSLQGTYTVLTGYVPRYLESSRIKLSARPTIDVGYRSREQYYAMGDLAQEKHIVADRFIEIAKAHKFSYNISIKEEDRIYGNDWIRFLQSTRFQLGTASGASVVDFTGDIAGNCSAYLRRHPHATYQELRERYFADVDGKVTIDTISPRIFEYAAIGNVMILHEGDYAGVVVPDVHYIPVKKDYSNIDEIVAKMRDPALGKRMVRAAYDDLIGSRKYNYEAFVKSFDETLDKHLPQRVRQAEISKAAFYLDRFHHARQFLVPVGARDFIIPSRGGRGHIFRNLVGGTVTRLPWLGRMYKRRGGDPFDKTVKGIIALQTIFSIRALRDIFMQYWRNPALRAEIHPERILEDLMRLALVWGAQSGGTYTGWSYNVALRYERPTGRLILTSHRLSTRSRVVGTILDDDAETNEEAFWSGLRDALANREVKEFLWDHSAVQGWVPLEVTRNYWVAFKPSRDSYFHLDAALKLAQADPESLLPLFRVALRGERLEINSMVAALFDPRRASEQFRLAKAIISSSEELRRFARHIVLSPSLWRGASPGRLGKELSMLALLERMQRGRQTAGTPFVAYFEYDAAARQFRIVTKPCEWSMALTPDKPATALIEGQTLDGFLTAFHDALKSGDAPVLIWDHSAVADPLVWVRPDGTWALMPFDPNGSIVLKSFVSLARRRSNRAVNALARALCQPVQSASTRRLNLAALKPLLRPSVTLAQWKLANIILRATPELREVSRVGLRSVFQVSPSRLLKEMSKLAILQQMQMGKISSGSPYRVEIDYDRDQALFTIRSIPCEWSEALSAPKPALAASEDKSLKDFLDAWEAAASAGRPLSLICDHKAIGSFLIWPHETGVWEQLSLDADSKLYCTAFAQFSRLYPKLSRQALAAILGYSAHGTAR